MNFTRQVGATQYFLLQGDITHQDTDAIVNAANSTLLGGGGVDGAIHVAGGPQILQECQEILRKQGKCKTGDAVITSGGKLKARYVIHTVGPVWKGGASREGDKLKQCYVNSLALAREHAITSIAFPSISTGAYRFPVELAAEIAQETVLSEMATGAFVRVGFVLFDQRTFEIYRQVLLRLVNKTTHV